MIHILIADDQKLLRESFKYIIENNRDMKVIGCVSNGKEAFDFCSGFIPDVILMDLFMPVLSGMEATKLIKSKYPKTKILILTASHDVVDIASAIDSGADGYILKDIGTEEFIHAIKSVVTGLFIIQRNLINTIQIGKTADDNDELKNKIIEMNGNTIELSWQQIQIMDIIVAGMNNKQIANELFMAEGTVKNKITDLIIKLNLKNRTQLAVFAIKNNLVS